MGVPPSLTALAPPPEFNNNPSRQYRRLGLFSLPPPGSFGSEPGSPYVPPYGENSRDENPDNEAAQRIDTARPPGSQRVAVHEHDSHGAPGGATEQRVPPRREDERYDKSGGEIGRHQRSRYLPSWRPPTPLPAEIRSAQNGHPPTRRKPGERPPENSHPLPLEAGP